MVKLIIRPIAEVVSEDAIERRMREYVEEILRGAKPIAEGLYLIEPPVPRATPSMLSLDCPVKAIIKLRIGEVTNMDGIRALARGRAVHDLYQDWFRAVNPRVHVEVESGIEALDTAGRTDILYMREVDGEERWGLIELKSVWSLSEDRERRYTRQVMAYVIMLREAGIDVREAYLVTMRDVKALPLKTLERELNGIIKELKALETLEWPMKPPNLRLCYKCEVRGVCMTYSNYKSHGRDPAPTM
ncbi:Dna2/Cas4 domain-containing protein [Vulcanisaeta thermophila]|uniref:Dna2/Cas4 domain-containing protein n=1 Tax=Vulcanisaeta thermophila TaxID=867917 RepID=UPI000853A15B|nr:Dna2/Cas4 domain-containing protein [Vulcanisaeta thermophila]